VLEEPQQLEFVVLMEKCLDIQHFLQMVVQVEEVQELVLQLVKALVLLLVQVQVVQVKRFQELEMTLILEELLHFFLQHQ
jgi:hypothetical protein